MSRSVSRVLCYQLNLKEYLITRYNPSFRLMTIHVGFSLCLYDTHNMTVTLFISRIVFLFRTLNSLKYSISPSQLLITINLLSVSVNFPILDIFCLWQPYHIYILRLAYFFQRSIFRVSLHGRLTFPCDWTVLMLLWWALVNTHAWVPVSLTR